MDNGHVKILADPVRLLFVNSKDETILEADVVELMVGVHECSSGHEWEHQCIEPFRDWIKKRSSVTVTLSQAETIYHTAKKQYAEFKKKFNELPKSPDSSISTLVASTVE